MKEFMVDVEVPHHEIQSMMINDAIKMFDLNERDVEDLDNGRVVWVETTAISKSEDQGVMV